MTTLKDQPIITKSFPILRLIKQKHYLWADYLPLWITNGSNHFDVFWVDDFNPSLVFKLTEASVDDLTRHQQDLISSLRSETRRKERDVMRDYALVQQSVADPPVMLAARRVGVREMVDGEESDLEEAMEVLKSGMAAAMNNADQLRCSTVGKVVEILTPSQAIKVIIYCMIH
ncbi:hypothetical protein EUTSA_v10005017mg [Eutrema salsugineum]|uniref:DOG1 domain-containing protein n=1 Tax=Eutrema salsugineum TaxID=72664 RepID=V4KJI7_EUTSA|nr:hypothetical protein EUTSA_v10005017mg [Eutrema salsugineum]